MEYNPKYPQPFTLTQAIALDPEVAWDEIARLRNSLLHLRRSQDELREYLRELASEDGDLEVSQAVEENEITIASQDERIFMLKLALAHHGHSILAEEQTSASSPSGNRTDSCMQHDNIGPTLNGSNNFSIASLPTGEVDTQDHGLYL